MTFKAFDKKFSRQVAKLSTDRQKAFALRLCKHLFPDYKVFCLQNGWGDPDVLLDAILLIESTGLEAASQPAIASMLKEVEKVSPDTEDFGGADYALNACCAVSATLEFLLTKNWELIYHAGISYYDSVDAKVQENTELSEEEINNHPSILAAQHFLLSETA